MFLEGILMRRDTFVYMYVVMNKHIYIIYIMYEIHKVFVTL